MSTTNTKIIPERLAVLDTLILAHGSHRSRDEGMCAMEVVAWLAGLGHTDAPECASPVLRAFTISLNDNWTGAQRQRLVPFLPRMVGTADDGQDEARSYMALDWVIRTYTPVWLDLAGLTGEASALRGLRRIVDADAARSAGPVLRDAQSKAVAAVDAARDAAWSASVARRAAAADAARDAARDAVWVAAGDAAWVAAQVAAWSAVRDASRDAAWSVAWSVAWLVVAWSAGDATRDALTPTVESLQKSALDLLDRMIDPGVGGEVDLTKSL